MTMAKYLILNADDFGMSQSANEAIEELFEVGYLTSTTLMTPCPWAEDAIARAKANPKMRVGLHTTLTSEWSRYRWGPVSRQPVPSLLDGGGYFHSNCRDLLSACTEEDVRTELHAQLDFMLARGLAPTHIDNHMGSVYGLEGKPLFRQVLELCARGPYAFRLPRKLDGIGQVPPALLQMQQTLLETTDAMGIGTLDSLLSNHQRLAESDGYDALKAIYLALIKGLGEGVNEIYMHPALDTPELRRMTPTWYTRVWEYRLLKDADLMDAIRAADVRLVGWTDAPLKGKRA